MLVAKYLHRQGKGLSNRNLVGDAPDEMWRFLPVVRVFARYPNDAFGNTQRNDGRAQIAAR
jgi:hypothetical protein